MAMSISVIPTTIGRRNLLLAGRFRPARILPSGDPSASLGMTDMAKGPNQ